MSEVAGNTERKRGSGFVYTEKQRTFPPNTFTFDFLHKPVKNNSKDGHTSDLHEITDEGR